MSSLLEDDTRYLKLLLLLVKGGTYVFKKHTQKILDNDKTTIDVCLEQHRDKLSEKKNIYPKLWELLCSNSGQPKDIDVLDISAHAYVLLNLFDKKLDAKEKTAISELKHKRNKLVHRGVTALSDIDFHIEWNQLMIILCKLSYTLSSDDEEYVNKLIEDITTLQHLDEATDELKPFENQDDFVIKELAKQKCSYERRFDELAQRISELERTFKEVDQSGFAEITARITVSAKSKRNIESGQSDKKQFVFRYQYLLIEVGTNMLKRVFHHIVGTDFMNNPSLKAKMQKFASRYKLTPSSDRLDITLLCSLLRDECNLCPSSDPVWSNPETKERVEAYIAKLKQCRNDFAHLTSVFEDDAVLTKKWDDLCLTLQGLSSFCGFGNLEAEIEIVKSIDLDPRMAA